MSSTRLPDTIYIGLQKTGSTFLRGYFEAHSQCRFTRQGVFFKLDDASPEHSAVSDIRSRYLNRFQDKVESGIHWVDVYEGLAVGYLLPNARGWTNETGMVPHRDMVADSMHWDFPTLCERIKATVPDAKILLTLREQVSWLSSNFREFALSLPAGQRRFQDFLATLEGKALVMAGQFDRTVETLWTVFGKERVHVILLEEIIRKEQETLKGLCEFLEIVLKEYPEEFRDYNTGRLAQDIEEYERNYLQDGSPEWAATQGLPIASLPADFAPEGGLSPSETAVANEDPYSMTDDAVAYLRAFYACSNFRLAGMLEKDIRQFGYHF